MMSVAEKEQKEKYEIRSNYANCSSTAALEHEKF